MPLRIKNAKKDKKRELSQARQARMIAEWREAEAQSRFDTGKPIVFKDQMEVAKTIYDELHRSDETRLLVSLIAPVQWGKTGVLVRTAYLMCTEKTPGFKLTNPNNVFFLTGMSDNDWKQQTKNRMLAPFNTERHVIHRGQLHIYEKQFKNIKDALIVIDECHIASTKGQSVKEFLETCGLLNIEQLQQRNVRILQTSATPDHVLIDSDSWGDYHFKICPEYGMSYQSFEQMRDEGRLHESLDLSDEDNITELIEEMYDFEDPRYHIIRLRGLKPEMYKHQLSIWNEYAKEHDLKLIEHNCTDRIDNVEKVLSQAPEQHTIILIKGFWTASKTLEDTYVGIVHENYSRSKDFSSEIQGLPGRFCGHGKKHGVGAPKIYCKMEAIDSYIELMNNGFNYRSSGVYLKTKSLKIEDGTIRKMKRSYLNPLGIMGLEEDESLTEAFAERFVPEEGVHIKTQVTEYDDSDPIYQRCLLNNKKGYDGARAFFRYLREQKQVPNIRDPFAKAIDNEYMLGGNNKRPYSLDETLDINDRLKGYRQVAPGANLKKLEKGNMKTRLFLCYQDLDEKIKRQQMHKPVFVVRHVTWIHDQPYSDFA